MASVTTTSSPPSLLPYAASNLNDLTLALGMTAGYAAQGTGPFQNPSFDPRIFGSAATLQDPSGASLTGQSLSEILRVGMMRNAKIAGKASLPGGQTYSLYFMFNPNQIVQAFQTNTGQIPAVYWMTTGVQSANAVPGSYTAGQSGVLSATQSSYQGSVNQAIPGIVGVQTVSWSLLFDRTYEMWDQSNPGWDRGVLADVAALLNLLGTFQGGANSPAVPYSTPVDVVFGKTGSGALWGFTGFITQVQITHGIFRYNMIPARCEIDITMQVNYLGSQAGSGNGSSAPKVKVKPTSPASYVITTPSGTYVRGSSGQWGPPPGSPDSAGEAAPGSLQKKPGSGVPGNYVKINYKLYPTSPNPWKAPAPPGGPA
jgi:hypothetical protein